MSAKLVVMAAGGGTQITLLGSTGKPLMHSPTFTEPRAKGATMRTLTALMPDVTVEDTTVRASRADHGASRLATSQAKATGRLTGTTRRRTTPTGRRTTARRARAG